MNIQFDVASGKGRVNRPDAPSCDLLLVGNFSGSATFEGNAGSGDSTQCNMFNLDPLDIDGTLSRIKPVARINTGDEEISLEFSRLDDFHPDGIFSSHPAFADIAALRAALNRPETSAEAAIIARGILGLNQADEAAEPKKIPEQNQTDKASVDDTFSSLLGRTAGGSGPVRDTLTRILEDAVSNSIVAEAPQDARGLTAQLDDWCCSAMRELMRSPEYRSVESSWLSVRWLAEQLDFDAEVRIWVADLGAAPPADWPARVASQVVQKLGDERVDLAVMLDEFAADDSGFQKLQALMSFAAQLSCPALGSAGSDLAGLGAGFDGLEVIDASHVAAPDDERWQSLRSTPEASAIALGYPRVLLRQPFGAVSDPVDAFAFEELEPAPDHESFPWYPASIALAVFWLRDRYGESLQIADLPLVTYDDGGGQAIKPASEIFVSESAIDALLKNGVIPIVGHRGHTDIRIPRLQSIAAEPTSISA